MQNSGALLFTENGALLITDYSPPEDWREMATKLLNRVTTNEVKNETAKCGMIILLLQVKK